MLKLGNSEILDNKFKWSHLKPNVATDRWYANKSLPACNVSE